VATALLDARSLFGPAVYERVFSRLGIPGRSQDQIEERYSAEVVSNVFADAVRRVLR
jgi:hypothetical protein